MTWFKIDDGFYDHPKVLGLDVAAVGLWALAGCYCARHLTDGVITDRQVRAIGGTRKQAEKLVVAGLWRSDGASPSARRYFFNDWSHFQPSRDEVMTKRHEDAERKRKAREEKRAKQEQRENVHLDVQTDGARTPQEASARSPLYPARPGPTRPDLSIGNEGGEGYVSNAHATPPPGNLDPDNPRCPDHAHIPATDRGPNCRACAAVRRWCEDEPERQRAAIRDNARIRRECHLCDESGLIETESGMVRCHHQQEGIA